MILKFALFYFLSFVTNFCFIIAAAKLSESNYAFVLILCYCTAVFVMMLFGYLGLKGLMNETL